MKDTKKIRPRSKFRANVSKDQIHPPFRSCPGSKVGHCFENGVCRTCGRAKPLSPQAGAEAAGELAARKGLPATANPYKTPPADAQKALQYSVYRAWVRGYEKGTKQ